MNETNADLLRLRARGLCRVLALSDAINQLSIAIYYEIALP